MRVVNGWAEFTGPGDEPGVVYLPSVVAFEEETIYGGSTYKRVIIHLENKLFVDRKHSLKDWIKAQHIAMYGDAELKEEIAKDPFGALLGMLDFAPVAPSPDLAKMAKGVKK